MNSSHANPPGNGCAEPVRSVGHLHLKPTPQPLSEFELVRGDVGWKEVGGAGAPTNQLLQLPTGLLSPAPAILH